MWNGQLLALSCTTKLSRSACGCYWLSSRNLILVRRLVRVQISVLAAFSWTGMKVTELKKRFHETLIYSLIDRNFRVLTVTPLRRSCGDRSGAIKESRQRLASTTQPILLTTHSNDLIHTPSTLLCARRRRHPPYSPGRRPELRVFRSKWIRGIWQLQACCREHDTSERQHHRRALGSCQRRCCGRRVLLRSRGQ